MRNDLVTWVRRLCVAGALAFIPGAFAAAQQGPNAHAPLTERFKSILQEHDIQGAAIILVENGAPTLEFYDGVMDAELGAPVTAQTRFRAGSVSKNITSLLALRLVESGVIDFNADLHALAPELRIDNPWRETAPVRFAHLLEHTAGLPGSSYAEYAFNEPDAPLAPYIARYEPIRLRWRPGQFYSYANIGHTIAAQIMADRAGTDFDTLVRREVFTPLGMDSATFRESDVPMGALSRSYAQGGARAEPFWSMGVRPSGALIVTPADLARVAALYARRGALPDGTPFVSAALLERMERGETSLAAAAGATEASYGLGNFGFSVGTRLWRGHWGKVDGFRTNMGYAPDLAAGFVIMVNTSDGAAMNALRVAVAEHLTRGTAAPASPPGTSASPDSAIPGIYENYTHDMPLRRWIFALLDQKRLEIVDGAVRVSPLLSPGEGRLVRPLSARTFVEEGFSIPTSAFVEADGRAFWVESESYRRVPAWSAYGRLTIVGLGTIAAAIAIVHAIVWGVLALMGRRAQGGAFRIPIWLFLAGASYVALFALFAQFGIFGSMGDLRLVGTLSWLSALLALLSLSGVAASAAALVETARETRRALTPFMAYAWPASLSLAAFSAFLAFQGWIPLITWRF